MYTWTIILAALAAFSAFIAICLLLPLRMTREWTFPNAQFDAVDNSRKTLAQVFGGAAIILTFAWSFSKDSETLEQARQQTANQQYLSSAQMLSDSNAVATRSAGIFSMGKVASVRTEYHMPVRDALAAFLSTRSALMLRERMDRPTRVEADVQAAIEVLGRRDRRNDDRSRMLNLEQNYLVGANFYRLNGFQGVSFQRAFLPGANFRYADLSEARFDGASMSDWQGYGPQAWRNEIASERRWEEWEKYLFIANFEGARLVGASFTGADLSGAKFTSADLTRADFRRANLSRADFTGALHWADAVFHNDDGTEAACADVPPKFDKEVNLQISPCYR